MEAVNYSWRGQVGAGRCRGAERVIQRSELALGAGEMPEQPSPKFRRRWLRLSVRGLMVFMLIIGTGLGWIARIAQRAWVQRDVVVAIQGAGGRVFYDGEWKDG